MTLQVDAYAEARRSLNQRLAELGGFVADAEIAHLDDRVSRGQLTLRIPSDRLDALVRYIATLGSVAEESLTTGDITEAYYDADAHLTWTPPITLEPRPRPRSRENAGDS